MKALENLKILDFTTLLPGPYATLMLSDMGADIIKISAPQRKDLVLEYEPFIEGTDLSANAAWLGRNKKNIFLDLKNESAVQIVYELIKEYDIVIEQFRPGVMERLGLGYETLKKINPKVIYCSLTGYGQYGPMSSKAGHDCNYMARSGNLSMAGDIESGPPMTNMQIADICSGSMNSIIGILSAVNYRHMTGKGQYIDVSMEDGLIPLLGMEGIRYLTTGEKPGRQKHRLNGGSVYGYYRTKDDEYLSMGSLEPKFWKQFCEIIDCKELIEGGCEPINLNETKTIIQNRILEKTRDEWMELFSQADCCVEPVLSVSEALQNDHIQARNMVVKTHVPKEIRNENTPETIQQLGFPIHFSESEVTYDTCGYPLGYHTKEVMESMGFDYEKLKEKGTFGNV